MNDHQVPSCPLGRNSATSSSSSSSRPYKRPASQESATCWNVQETASCIKKRKMGANLSTSPPTTPLACAATSTSFPSIWRVDGGPTSRKQEEALASLSQPHSEMKLWRSGTGALAASRMYPPTAGLGRKLGVISLALDWQKTREDGTRQQGDWVNQLVTLLQDRSPEATQAVSPPSRGCRRPSSSSSLNKSSRTRIVAPTKPQARKEALEWNRGFPDDTGEISSEDLQSFWQQMEDLGPIQPQWTCTGHVLSQLNMEAPSIENDLSDSVFQPLETSCQRLLTLLRGGILQDICQSQRHTTLCGGWKSIPTDARSILESCKVLMEPSDALYSIPMLLCLFHVTHVEKLAMNDETVRIHLQLGMYGHRLLWDIMTKDSLEICMAALDPGSFEVVQGLTTSPISPRWGNQSNSQVFQSDPQGPQVSFDAVDEEVEADGNTKTPMQPQNSPTLDAFTPSGFLKWIENTGCDMEDYEQDIAPRLQPFMNVDLLLHQQHALSFMYQMENSVPNLNSLLWEKRQFAEGDTYWYSPALGQLRLQLQSHENVKGGILADEMGLGKTCSILALIAATREKLIEAKQPEEYFAATTLIIVPPALLTQWLAEIKKCTRQSLVVDVLSPVTGLLDRRVPGDSQRQLEDPPDICLTTYPALAKGSKRQENKALKLLLSNRWGRVVLDELQEIRSHTMGISQNCCSLQANRRWMLSGTPLFEGFDDFRGELNFLHLDPFSAQAEDGFFEFAVTSHLEARSRHGLETLRILSFLMLRRSKSMLIRETQLPLLGLKPMNITFVPVVQDDSDRALYCFLEHLMHSVLEIYSNQESPEDKKSRSRRKKDRARCDKKSFLNMLRSLCFSPHLLNGGFGCSAQLGQINRWMQTYNRSFIGETLSNMQSERNEGQTASSESLRKDQLFTCDEAIQFISQADNEIRTSEDFVSDMRMTWGGGAASRSRATLVFTKDDERLSQARAELRQIKELAVTMILKRAKLRWHFALEKVTTGALPDEDYSKVSQKKFSGLWKLHRTPAHTSSISDSCWPRRHGWRPSPSLDTSSFKWSSPCAMTLTNVPSQVTREDIERSLAAYTRCSFEKDNATINIRFVSAGTLRGKDTWNALILLPDACSVDKIEKASMKRQGLTIKSKENVPQVVEMMNRAKDALDHAEALVAVHPSARHREHQVLASREWKFARHGLRAYPRFVPGHICLKRAVDKDPRRDERPTEQLLESLSKSIADCSSSIRPALKKEEALRKEIDKLESRLSNKVSESVKRMTCVEALQALENGKGDETTCPVCQEPLGSSGNDGLVTATMCGHLSCRVCFQEWQQQKIGIGLTCMECRKPVDQTITIDPTITRDDEALNKRMRPGSWCKRLPLCFERQKMGNWSHVYGKPYTCRLICQGMCVDSAIGSFLRFQGIFLAICVRPQDLPQKELSVVFASTNAAVKHLLAVLKTKGFGCRGLFTGQSERDSKATIDEWHGDSNVSVLIVQSGAAACGLTLTAACKMFLMEPLLKYEEEQQAYARLHRYGQTKAVDCKVYYTPVSIESRLLEWRKRTNQYTPKDEKLSYATLDNGMNGDIEEDLDEEELDNQTKFLLNLQTQILQQAD